MQRLDARGKSCPLPIVLTAKALRVAASGDELEVHADDRAFPDDIRAWCKKMGNELVSLTSASGAFVARIRRT